MSARLIESRKSRILASKNPFGCRHSQECFSCFLRPISGEPWQLRPELSYCSVLRARANSLAVAPQVAALPLGAQVATMAAEARRPRRAMEAAAMPVLVPEVLAVAPQDSEDSRPAGRRKCEPSSLRAVPEVCVTTHPRRLPSSI